MLALFLASAGLGLLLIFIATLLLLWILYLRIKGIEGTLLAKQTTYDLFFGGLLLLMIGVAGVGYTLTMLAYP